MNFGDYLRVSGGNLRRMKFRASLTIAGIVIAIGAFVCMLTFGAGNQAYVTKQYTDLGLFTTMQVFPKNREGERRWERSATRDTGTTRQIDENAIHQLARIPGVNLVYPFDPVNARVRIHDSTFETRAQSLPYSAAQTRLFSNLVAGREFSSDSARSAIVSTGFLKKAGVGTPDSAIGMPLILSVRVSVLDSGIAHIMVDHNQPIWSDARRLSFDSLLRSSRYRRDALDNEINEVVRRFFNGFMNSRQTIAETLAVCGVNREREGPLHVEDVIVPAGTAAKLTSGGFTGNPADIFSGIATGNFSLLPSQGSGKTFSQVTLDLDPSVFYKSIRDSVAALGFRSFSFAEQFEQIQQFFIYFDMGLGIVGLIALATASLGIVNTMVMSISERRKEIGILKSLGAHDSDIRNLFLIESGVMGAIGTVVGILAGWGVSRIISAVVKFYMNREGLPQVELFALPLWLIGVALAVGIGVSVLAGTFPAARAARVDPVEALRNE